MAQNRTDKGNYSVIRDSQLEWPHWVYQWISIHLLWLWYSLSYRIRIYGRENRPKQWMPMVVACNHTSNLDPPLVSIALNYTPISFMAKQELFDSTFLRIYNYAMSSFAVNRQKLELSTVKSALRILKHGKWALGIFPEGTRNQDGQVKENKRGVAYFAKSANVPILPLAIVQMKKNGRKQVNVLIGELIPPDGDMDTLGQTIQETIRTLTEKAGTLP